MGKLVVILIVLGAVLAIPLLNDGYIGGVKFVMPDFGSPTDLLDKNVTIGSVVTDRQVRVYKWYDDKGVQHFSNTPPAGVNEVDVVELSPDTNVIKAIDIPVDESEAESGRGSRSVLVGSPYSPDSISNTINGAKSLTESLNQQQAAQQKMIEQILGNK